jgi:hypothetical protein
MPALVAGIHVFSPRNKAWMAGTSPAMTTNSTSLHHPAKFPQFFAKFSAPRSDSAKMV